MFKVYVTDYDYPDLEVERAVLEPIGAEVIGLQDPTGTRLAELAVDADGLLEQYAKIDAATIARLDRCKVIARYGIGTDILDLDAADRAGIVVTNVPDYCIDEVSDHSISMALMLARSIPSYNIATHAGRWHWTDWNRPITRLREATFGLVGFGRIAQNMAHKLAAFGFQILAYDPYVSAGAMRSHGVHKAELDELLRRSDIVDVMCPYTPETHHLIDERALGLMRDGSILINCARANIVDNAALFDALSTGHIASAGLDDIEGEPAKTTTWNPDNNPLFSLANCVITPHAAYISEQSLIEARQTAAENVRAVLLGQTPPNPIHARHDQAAIDQPEVIS